MKIIKIKKFFKENLKTIFAIILTSLLVGCTTAFASYSYFAKDIEYEKNDGTKLSVNDALNDLYNKSSNRLYLYWYGDTCDSVTGGWGNTVKMTIWADGYNTAVNNIPPKFEENCMDYTITSTYQCISSNTLQKINCSQYNYVNILYSMSQQYQSYFRFSINDSVENYAQIWNETNRNGFCPIINHNGLMMTSYPINNLSDGYFAINTLRGISSDTITNLKVYGVFLSKEL